MLAAILAAVLATTLAVAACGGSSPNSRKARQVAFRNTALRLAACLRGHGVPDFPDPQSGGGFGIQQQLGGGGGISVDGHSLNVSAPAFQRAMQDCRRYMPQGPPISGSQLARIKQSALKMSECMRAHGVPNFPDPQITVGPGGHGIMTKIGGAGANIDPNSPGFTHAMSVCNKVRGAQKIVRIGS